MTITVVIISSTAVLALAGLAVAVAHEDASRRDAWRRIAASRRQRSASPGGEYDALDKYWATNRHSRRSALLLKLAQIENAASDVLDERLGHRTWQLFEIRSELRRLGIWSDDDVVTFDQAMKLRNAVVHGSARGSTETDGRVSDDDLDLLLAKVNGDNRNTHVA